MGTQARIAAEAIWLNLGLPGSILYVRPPLDGP